MVVVVDAPVVIVVITFGFVMVSGLFEVTGVDSTLLQLSVLLQQKSPDAIPFVILPVWTQDDVQPLSYKKLPFIKVAMVF